MRHYTEEQFEALDAIDLNPRIVFDGPAGTGKTLLAIEAARRAVESPGAACCCSASTGRSAAGCRRRARRPRRPGVTARTLHEHLRLLAGIAPTREQRCRQEFWQEELPAMALEALLEREAAGSANFFDEIVLDEAQDVLRRSYLDVLDLSLNGGLAGGHWRFFGDFTWQRIYDAAALTVDEFLEPPAEARAAGAERHLGRALRAAHQLPQHAARGRARRACGHVLPGYKRVRRPDDEVEPEVAAGTRTAAQQLELLRSVLTDLRGRGLHRPARRRLSPHGNEGCAAAQLTEQPWRDRLDPLVQRARRRDRRGGGGRRLADGLHPQRPRRRRPALAAGSRTPRSTASRASRRRRW